MSILQIACGYSFSKLYDELFSAIADKHIDIIVYVPERSKDKQETNMKSRHKYTIISDLIIKPYDKYLYFSRTHRTVQSIESNLNLRSVSCIHAHSLFSDGSVAYQLWKKFSIPYIVAIRNTDVNKYFRMALHLRKYGNLIMQNAEKIVFISPAYYSQVMKKYVLYNLKKEIERKAEIIPNGMNQYWVDNIHYKDRKRQSSRVKLVFVGALDKNKNLLTVIKAMDVLKRKNVAVTLDIVGDGPLREKIQILCNSNKIIFLHGYINDRERLQQVFDSCDIFCLPSFNETFGLVYLEAMSRGLPVIYTKGQGFDGWFENGKVGYAVNPKNATSIANAVVNIITDYDEISYHCCESVSNFDWGSIAQRYINIYNILNEKK